MLELIAMVSLAVAAPNAVDAAQTRSTVSVPLHEVVLSDGTRRFGIPINVAGNDIVAGLDTGSTGLRVKSTALPWDKVKATTTPRSVIYANGTALNGVEASVDLSMGGLSGTTTIQLVKAIGCSIDNLKCPASAISFADFGIQGNGIPRQGFPAIFGINTSADPIGNPLSGIGVRRWIVNLPRSGAPQDGELILNPSDAATATYVEFPLDPTFAKADASLHDGIDGCLENEATNAKICGLVMLDTGAPGIIVVNQNVPQVWANGTPMTLQLVDSTGALRPVEHLTAGLRSHASRLSFLASPGTKNALIYVGFSPYLALSVLYDPQKGTIGLAPRAMTTDGPRPALDEPAIQAANPAARLP